ELSVACDEEPRARRVVERGFDVAGVGKRKKAADLRPAGVGLGEGSGQCQNGREIEGIRSRRGAPPKASEASFFLRRSPFASVSQTVSRSAGASSARKGCPTFHISS